jgi:hypothetical protein
MLNAAVAVTAALACMIGSANGQPPLPTDDDGVPWRAYLTIETCDGGRDCKGTCDIKNNQDHSRMSCDEWFSRYCPPSLNNVHCKVFLEEVTYARRGITPPLADADGVPRPQYLSIRVCYGGIDCKGTCDIDNNVDHSTMSCAEWFRRYCPPSLENAHCKVFEEDVGVSIERD